MDWQLALRRSCLAFRNHKLCS